MRSPELIEVVVLSRRLVAEGVVDLELEAVDGSLPAVEPGAHLDVHLPGGLIRQYSVHQYDPQRHRYRLGVGLAAPSRGGSAYVHERLEAGQRLQVSAPRNNFPLSERCAHYFFIAGGIGITPILSMVRWCEANGRSWSLLYAVRSRTRAAYLTELPEDDRVRLHADDESAGDRPDLAAFLAVAGQADEVYCCGPAPLMDAVAETAAFLPRGSVHFERFTADPQSASEGEERPFKLILKASGLELTVEPGSSVLETLEAAGVAWPFSCREGLCRTCECQVLAGEVEHRDFVLSEEERESNQVMMVCCSRARSAVLELDL